MMSLKSFSQTDTLTSTIQLTKPIAKLVVKDLIQLDGMSKEFETLQNVLSETNLKFDEQSKLVVNLTLLPTGGHYAHTCCITLDCCSGIEHGSLREPERIA